MTYQKTLAQSVSCTGIGVHSGATACLTLKPAKANSGYVFIRTDITDKNNRIEGRWQNVADTTLCTVLANNDGVTVGTVEHVLSALAAAGVDNAVIEINGPEMPIMDGSAADFLDMIDQAGVKMLNQAKRYLRLKKTVTYTEDDKTVTLSPSAKPLWDMIISFDTALIGRQVYRFDGDLNAYRQNIADSRTFGFLHEVEMMKNMGLARGGSLDNAVVIDKDSVLNPDGLRHSDEFVRHKLLDAIGDIALGGAPLLAHYQGYKAGHALNNKVLHAVFADKTAFEFVTLQELRARARKAERRTPIFAGEPEAAFV
ncbi:MAG: UDP-3-O-acyl-N-acetylglucosamine deacetylase [Pseudomonadota bacterium]